MFHIGTTPPHQPLLKAEDSWKERRKKQLEQKRIKEAHRFTFLGEAPDVNLDTLL